MKVKLYAIHDQAINEFIGPDLSKTHGEAERKFKDAINNPDSGILYKHPQQFVLFHIGEYDSETGLLENNQNGPQSIMNGIQAKRPVDDNPSQMRIAGT